MRREEDMRAILMLLLAIVLLVTACFLWWVVIAHISLYLWVSIASAGLVGLTGILLWAMKIAARRRKAREIREAFPTARVRKLG